MSLIRSMGLVPDRPETRAADRQFSANYKAAQSAVGFYMQGAGDLRDQVSFPSCVGQSLAACIDGLNPGVKASAVSIWREARRRQGKIESITEGTRFEYAVEGLVHRGWDTWKPGEDASNEEAGAFAPPAGDDLADELFAHDKRITAQRSRISEEGEKRYELIEVALQANHGVVIGIGTRPKFLRHTGVQNQPDVVLGLAYLGGDVDGHGMRVRAFWRDRDGNRIYMLQNSWGPFWGGCHGPDKVWYPGCVWVSQAVINVAWDLHVVEFTTKKAVTKGKK